MAVTKIHKTSRLVFYITIIISLIVIGLYLFGGQVAPEQKIAPDMSQPQFTEAILYWIYVLLGFTIVALLGFAILGFFRTLKTNPKKAMTSLLIVVALAAVLFVSYMIGDGTILNIPGYDGSDNNPSTLKFTDMWIYSIYFMLAVTIGAIFLSPLMKKIKK